jgi:hypothetical protein
VSFESVLNPVTFNREVNLYFNEKNKFRKFFNKFLRRSLKKNSLVVKIESSYDFFIGKKENENENEIFYFFLFFAKPEECKSS